jgi:hypothetical protein
VVHTLEQKTDFKSVTQKRLSFIKIPDNLFIKYLSINIAAKCGGIQVSRECENNLNLPETR